VKLLVVLPIIVLMVVLRLARAGLLLWVAVWWAGLYAVVRYGFVTPMPDSAVRMYMAITTLALLAYVTSSRERSRAVTEPILTFVTDRRYTLPLALVVLLIPALAAWRISAAMNVPVQPPFFARTVHPSPPMTISVHNQEIDLLRGDNPLRALEKTDPKAFAAHSEKGRQTYYRNCFYCHGDSLAGDGMFAHAVNPLPANFLDGGVLPMLQETFFFWRIAKGGPGMPDEGAPGDSVMPEWERFLSTEEIWEVILFLYDYTGYRPRALEEHGGG
jgi:cbb3-type cytochrome c oxidase subunit III